MVILLLIRPHNIIAFAMVVVVEYVLSMHLVLRMNLGASALTLLYVWFGQAGFFFQVRPFHYLSLTCNEEPA
jgi:hypothetical protein